MADPGKGPGGPAPLSFRSKWRPKSENSCLETAPPPYLWRPSLVSHLKHTYRPPRPQCYLLYFRTDFSWLAHQIWGRRSGSKVLTEILFSAQNPRVSSNLIWHVIVFNWIRDGRANKRTDWPIIPPQCMLIKSLFLAICLSYPNNIITHFYSERNYFQI